VEVIVPAEDVDRLKRIAATLRSHDPSALALRQQLDLRTGAPSGATGLSLFPFLGNPLFEDFELELPDRNCDTYTPVDLSEE